MTFDAWLSMQRATIATLRAVAGEYLAWYHRPREGNAGYKASPRVTVAGVHQHVVKVTRYGVTRARVLRGAAEYDYEPVWVPGLGLDAHRCSPTGRVAEDVAALTKGLARAALLRAAEDEYTRLQALAIDATADGEDWGPALWALTADADGGIDAGLRASIVEALRGREDGVELAAVRDACACIGCGQRFEPGPTGCIVAVFGDIVCCGPCLRPARAA